MAEIVFNIDNTALETVKSLSINANWKEMETQLAELVAPYQTLIVTEDGMSQAKTDRARLRKLRDNIDDRRKLVKKIYTEPLTVFEANCKRLIEICNSGANNLDEQIKGFESRVKAQKLLDLQDYFTSLEKKHPEHMMFDECVNPKWTNITYPIETAQQEIENYVLKIDRDIDAIKGLGSKYESLLLNDYKKNRDVASVLTLKQKLDEADRQAELKKREEEEARKRREEEMRRRREEEERLVRNEARPIPEASELISLPEEREEERRISASGKDREGEKHISAPGKKVRIVIACYSDAALQDLIEFCSKDADPEFGYLIEGIER